MDLAKLGFSADTAALSDAKAKLDAIVPAGTRAAAAADKFNNATAGITRSTTGAATGIKGFGAAVQQAAAGTAGVSRAALMAGSAMGTVQTAAVGAAASISRMNVVAQQFGPPTAAFTAYQAALAKVNAQLDGIPPAANNASGSLQRLGKSANDNILRLQSTPGNVAAQFQDIGVTAAGGMQPFLIALQQGTQLSAAMSGGMGSLLAGIRMLFSPIALVTIAAVYLIATLIQLAMGGKRVSDTNNELVKSMDLTERQLKRLRDSGVSTAVTWGDSFKALVQVLSSDLADAFPTFFKGISDGWDDAISQMISDTGSGTKHIIADFTGAYYAVVALWNNFPQTFKGVVALAVNGAIALFEGLLNRVSKGINDINGRINGLLADAGVDFRFSSLGEVSLGRVQVEEARVAGEAVARGYGEGYAKGAAWAESVDRRRRVQERKNAQDRIREAAGDAEKGRKAGNKRDPWRDLVEGAENDIAKERARAEAVTLGAEAAAKLEQQTKLLNQANSAGIKLTDAMRQKIDALSTSYARAKVQADNAVALKSILEQSNQSIAALQAEGDMIGKYGRELAYATEYARLFADAQAKLTPDALAQTLPELERRAGRFADISAGNDSKRFLEDQRVAHNERMAALGVERAAIGMTAQASAAFRIETDLLAEAKRRNIALSPRELSALRQYAQGQAEAAERVRQMQDAFNFARDGARGFLSDLKSGLEQGKSVFRAFADTVTNMLDKVINKLMDLTVDAMLSGNTSGTTGFIKGLTSIFSGKPTANALGGVYGPEGRITRYAKGGVVNGSTFFNSASGMGEMGERGPEGILPLKRGPDGALGVTMSGGRGARAAPVVNVNNHYTIAGAIDGGTIASQIRQSAEQTADQVRRAIPQVLAEYQQNGAVA